MKTFIISVAGTAAYVSLQGFSDPAGVPMNMPTVIVIFLIMLGTVATMRSKMD